MADLAAAVREAEDWLICYAGEETYDASRAIHKAGIALSALLAAARAAQEERDRLRAALRWLRNDMPYRAPETLKAVMDRVWIPYIDKTLAPALAPAAGEEKSNGTDRA